MRQGRSGAFDCAQLEASRKVLLLLAACASMALGCEKRKAAPTSSTVITSGSLESARAAPLAFEGEVDVVIERLLAPPVTASFLVKGSRARSDVLEISHAVYDLSTRRARFFDDARRTYFDGPVSDELALVDAGGALVRAGRHETHAGIACDVWLPSAPAPRGTFEICLPTSAAPPRSFSCGAALPVLDSGALVPACRSDVAGTGESRFSVTRVVRRAVSDELFDTPRGYEEKRKSR